MEKKIMRVGIIGAGAISDIYMENISAWRWLISISLGTR